MKIGMGMTGMLQEAGMLGDRGAYATNTLGLTLSFTFFVSCILVLSNINGVALIKGLGRSFILGLFMYNGSGSE